MKAEFNDDYTPEEVARILGVTSASVAQWCRERGFGYRPGPTARWRVPKERVERIRAERAAAASAR